MQSRNQMTNLTGIPPSGELARTMSTQEFAQLGSGSIVFQRPISGEELADYVPQARNMPSQVPLTMLMAADGAPVLVTDNEEAISEWVEENAVTLVALH